MTTETTLNQDIRTYKSGLINHLHKIEEFYSGMGTLIEVVAQAANAIDPNKKMNPHQFHIGKEKCSEASEKLTLGLDDFVSCRSFKDIFEKTEDIRLNTNGLGDLWSYDTALRIGFYLKMYPEEVYIQRGVIAGAKKALKRKDKLPRTLPLEVFPKALQSLSPFEAENFLCIWGKGYLKAC